MSKVISSSYRLALPAGCSAVALGSATLSSRAADYINPNSFLISTPTYQDVGQVAGLVAGSSLLPGSKAGKTSTAASNGNLDTVWDNEAGAHSFGVTSAITLQDLNANSTNADVLASKTLNPSLVSTSFSSKSELSLNLARSSSGYVATFMGYNAGEVGTPSGLLARATT
jgi:hypothetical protein